VRKPVLRALLIFGIWTLVGLVTTEIRAASLALRGEEVAWARILLYGLASVWLWALYTPAVLRMAKRWPVLGSGIGLRSVAVHTLFALGLTLLDTVLLSRLITWAVQPETVISLPAHFFSILTLNLFSYAVVACAGSAGALLRELRDREAAAERLEAQLARAQLVALRSQLHPHFFFNTLNAIAELVHRDAEAADLMIARLASFLRRSLEAGDAHEVPLGEELEAMEAYLDVVRLRFGDRVAVSVEVEPDALGALVPPLLLQPLVENAVRHGLEPSPAGGRLEVVGARRGDRLVLEVRDDGVGLPADPEARREGIGLRNTRDRLRRLHGDAATLGVTERPGGGVAAVVMLPYRTGVGGGGEDGGMGVHGLSAAASAARPGSGVGSGARGGLA